MAAEEAETLESWLNKATNPLNSEEKWEYIKGFCDQVNLELEGPQIATRLLGHKIQSPQEKEALYALTVLEACMNNCGKRFQNEAGKYRFLNDLIKVLSPKYLGTWSSETVKARIIEMMYSWTLWLPSEIKIRDAYQMLKKQGVIKKDPKLPNVKPFPPPSPRMKSSLFDDEEKSKLLARLLKSNNPEDLQAANRLIKNVIKEDQEKTEKITKRIHAIEEVQNNTKLLNEMLNLYQRDSLPKDQIEILKGLYQRCEKLRPTLFRLASDTTDNDEALVEILQANDSLTLVVNLYKKIVEGHEEDKATSKESASTADTMLADLTDLESDLTSSGTVSNLDSKKQLPSWLDEELMSLGLNDPPMMQQVQRSVNRNTSEEVIPSETISNSTTNGSRGLAGLDLLGKTAMEQSLGPRMSTIRWDQPQVKPTLNELQNQSLTHQLAAAKDSSSPATSAQLTTTLLPQWTMPFSGAAEFCQDSASQPLCTVSVSPTPQIPSPARCQEAGTDDLSLKNVFVPLENIKASSVPPVTVFDKDGFQVLFHFAKALPVGRPDLLVVVITLLNSSPTPIKNITFQAAVPKVMKVKLQPASGTELPAFNPVLSPPVISQVMLLANPKKERVRLRYKLLYTLAEQIFTEVGEVTEFPAMENWGNL
ncbi:ADP-ribosylation factor-binding protein GGA1-like isoform X2 [Chiloscyllium plagiosum]|uniref:ADP-ribosylation factor-binding protein GGA1-like isoform X1 n=1 Tax=Chiloscyllium plagiosum TaxID=36176 RepID=UPI001CB7B819|nr:ADP-ribosylation factor-binding protein GGA1-like isoform X1 [Chiloscyllium plagiosum]XP_043567620.1 ADP-ribosylation factor-binding protein GGA1-like isoform X2 [Chiloscyllium plagiosum]